MTRYLPYDAYRTMPTQTVTDRLFTGHKHNDDLGLVYMNARFYVPSVGRFVSADTIVPDPVNPQSYNRYSYVRNSPLNFTDPTGHREIDCDLGLCTPTSSSPTPAQSPASPQRQSLNNYYRKELEGVFSFSAYVFADEGEFSGPKVDIPGVPSQQANWSFLYGSGGVVMQGTGILENGTPIHIVNYEVLTWADSKGRQLKFDKGKGWVVAESGEPSTLDRVYNWEQARFARGYGREGLVPYSSVAAPPRFAEGTMLYVPDLAPYTPSGGIFIVQDRGGLIDGNKFDLFVGVGFTNSNAWFALGDKRFNLTVYQLVPMSCPPGCQ